ncbi:MAG: hypothetical protein MJ075_02750 [Oscillospiraceae bacterium]|nr:hypothetical protein [Oscillospiraceae bacterium]
MLESDSYYELWQQQGPESQQILDFLESHMEDLAPELMPALRCMLDYGLYDLDRGANRADIGYTTNLYSYGVPFLFSLAYGDAEDYTNAIHEFGHFNQMYHHAGHYLYDYSDYDLSEVHSQGLELLFLEYAEDMVGEEYEEDFCRYTIWSMLDSVIEGCLYDEFLELAFEEENPSPDGLRELFQQVSVEYGYDGNDGEIWTEISHNFESPFYYISYSVSAMTALELYTESLKDREGAIETYLKLTALPADTGFLTAVKKVGMSNPLQENSIKEMADVLNRRYLQGEEQPEEATAVRKQDGGKGLLVISIGGLILIIGLLTLGALLQRRREQAAEAGLTEEKDNPM